MVWVDFFFRIKMTACVRKAFPVAAATLVDMKSEKTGCCFRQTEYLRFDDYAMNALKESHHST